MTPIVWTYIIYIALSIPLTVWVAQTLHKNGRVFLIDSFHGKEQLAGSVNHLLVVGFYLINIGYVALALKEGIAPADLRGVFETLRPNDQLLVISDDGSVYRGAYAWIMCLWALRKYREHAQRLAHPILVPFARIVCELLSRNRFFLSGALFRQDARSAAKKLTAHYHLHKATSSNAACTR